MQLGPRLAIMLAAVILPASSIGEGKAQPSAAPVQRVRSAWGFDRSDLPPHPGVRFGVLTNGMRYALMKNEAPAGGLSARLRFDVGATAEGEREQGFMHLLEHLIFHGSQNIPDRALPLMLTHRGLKRTSDFNAFTSFDETVYRLDLARADRNARDAALMLMREVSSRLLFTRRGVKGAKKSVGEEIRARDAVRDRLAAAQNAFVAPGTPIARGPVAGTQASVTRATPAALRRLYQLYYVPRRATLVLVGDFDPALVEAEIEAHFADWQGPAVAQSREAGGSPPPILTRRDTEARLFVHRAAPTSITIASVQPLGDAADRGARRDTHFLQRLGTDMLNRRLARISGAPFVSASAAVYDHFATARVASLELAARDRDWRGALKRGELELRRALEKGFSEAELAEQLSAIQGALAQDAAPRTSSALADAIIDAVSRGIVFTEPAAASGTDAYLARVRLADVNAAFRAAWSDPARLLFVSHDRRIPGGEAAILTAWREGYHAS